jgi:glycosyltransferase involved in cell wall biosynthesis
MAAVAAEAYRLDLAAAAVSCKPGRKGRTAWAAVPHAILPSHWMGSRPCIDSLGEMSEAEGSPFASVVICTRDRHESLGKTLESVLAQDYPDYQVLVVDQSSGDETCRLVETMGHDCARLRYLRLERPGLSRAYNAGIRATNSPLLVFTDDDVTVPPDWLSRVATAFAQNPTVGLLYGQVLIPPELVGSRDGVTPALGIPERRILDRKRGFRVFGMGANFAARRQLLERVGGFDEVLGGGGPLQSAQDFDLLYRVYKAGESTLLEPEVVVYHYGFRSLSGEWQATMRSYGVGVGGFYFKHVRLGDPYAVWLLLGSLAYSVARVAKRCLTRRPVREEWSYLAHIVRGMRRSLNFPIDRRLRLYRMRT